MPAPPEQQPDPSPEAELIYAQAILDLPKDRDFDLSALCAAHPAEADSLRRLHDVWEQLRAQRGPTDRLKTDLGANASVQGSTASAAEFSSKVMARLSGRQSTASRYKLEGEIARGGMGAILRVWDEDLRRHLAMKVVLNRGEAAAKGSARKTSATTLARFLEEAQITGQLDHPGIVPVHELGLDAEGQVYFTMKLVKGQTLKTVLDELEEGEGGWTQTRVLSLLLRVCEAMAYAHDKGVIHRDLKPANVMVGRFGEVYVMDWGLAKILGREDTKDLRVKPETALGSSDLLSERRDPADELSDSPLVTMDGDVVGTPAYMSPEQAAGNVAAMGPASDVYAVGAMLYQLLAGHTPYVPRGARLNYYAIWHAVQTGPPKPLHEEAPRVPAELVAICEKAMARDARARYANTSELAEDLSAYIEGRVVRAYEAGAWAEARKWIKRNKPLAAALAAAVLAIALGGVGFAFKAAQATEAAALARSEADRADAKTQEAQTNLTLAQQSEAEAQAQRGRAEAETAKVLRLSDVKVLQDLEAEAEELWPADPGRIAALESWLQRARALTANLAGHRATLAEMRTRAQPWSADQRARDRATHPRADELVAMRAELEGLVMHLDEVPSGAQAKQADARVAELEPQLAALETAVSARRTFLFDSTEDQWQHDLVAELIGNLQGLDASQLQASATSPGLGWSVAGRLAFARKLEAGFAVGGEFERAWSQALPAIRAAYPGLDLEPQVGLFPLGPDPDSALWEFAHLATGEPAARNAAGHLSLTEATGVVLVLIPASTFWMGSQNRNQADPNFDRLSGEFEGPVHEVRLSAYFLSKYEMTQGQWKRLTGVNPSTAGPDGRWGSQWLSYATVPSLLHPVERISWLDCMRWLPRAGLQIPSEAQWECGARGGTQTPWWSGSDLASLEGVANLADRYGRANGAETWTSWEEDFDDGATVHAAVGTYAANAFGLHEVHGNITEWCLDGFERDFYSRSPAVDPVAPWKDAPSRVFRGGAWNGASAPARSASRLDEPPTREGDILGVRPARPVE